MAFAEYAVVNPRRRRRRKVRRHARARSTTTRRRRRRHVARALNPRRRRRVYAARRRTTRHHRRRRRNPRGLRLGGGNVVKVIQHGVGLAAGAAAAEIANDLAAKYLPANLTSGGLGVAVQGGIGIVLLPMLLRATPLKRFAPTVALGAAVVTAYNLYVQFVKPHLPGMGVPATNKGLGVYSYDAGGVNGLGVYGPPMLEAGSQGVAGLGWGEDSMYADSMYT